ncbi:phage tail protein [Haemophilus parainfluenzae]|uniref:phage tail-collar fiber domain-containing protein n=1 Tax=Haemophilus parainfluenzae TaxID=729 RepID=UPI000A695130|nr:phage tail protein [Haemophilus parainfluenzae]
MASLITPQFERYVAEQTVARGTVQFDEFIFANIPGLNENNLAQYLTMPTSAQIVHRQSVSQSGVINENAVVYSVTIGTEVGDFDFNFIGLINKSKNMLAVAVQTAPVKKIRNKNAVQGNSITRNILLEFSGAKALTGINVNANTWQIDFTVRLHGLDEKIRLTNRDLYGRAVFFDDGFLVKRKTGNQFTIQPGVAYVEGVRMDLTALYNLTANNLPCSVYADVVHHCTVTGEYQTEIKYLTQSKADYVDTANRQHYVQILADIDSQGNVTDRRLLSPFLGMNPLTLDDTTENTKDKLGHTHKLPIASLVKRGIVKLFSGYDSDAEDMAATPKAIKGLKALIDAIQRNLGNYIPNSKKSSRVDSNSADTVATSAAVKTAYDKGVEAKTAADNAQHSANDGINRANNAQSSANAANNNANGRVSKSGDEMSGNLVVASSYSGGFAKGFIVKNKADGKGTSGFVDFYQTDNAPRASLWFRDMGNGSCDVEILTSPEGSNINEDKRDLHTKFYPDGSLWVKKYGFLHDYFMTRGDFSSSWYPNHYAGTEVYKIRHLGLMITVMNLGAGNAGEYYLPEAYNGHALAWVTDNGGARGVGVSGVYDGNKIRLHGGNTISRSVLVIGRKNW